MQTCVERSRLACISDTWGKAVYWISPHQTGNVPSGAQRWSKIKYWSLTTVLPFLSSGKGSWMLFMGAQKKLQKRQTNPGAWQPAARAFVTERSHIIIRICLALGQLHFNCNRKEVANELALLPESAFSLALPAAMVLGGQPVFLLLLGLSPGEGKFQSPIRQELSTRRLLCFFLTVSCHWSCSWCGCFWCVGAVLSSFEQRLCPGFACP